MDFHDSRIEISSDLWYSYIWVFAPKIHIESQGRETMAKKEANFDLYIYDLLVEAGIQADTQGSNIVPINDALKTASKHQTGKAGFP